VATAIGNLLARSIEEEAIQAVHSIWYCVLLKMKRVFDGRNMLMALHQKKRVDMATELKAWEESDEGQKNIIKDSQNNHIAIIAAAIIGLIVGFVLGFLI
jgi:hypothetical protein